VAGRVGRPLDRRRDRAILQAALSGLADLGYDRLTMDEVAARAHASKGTIYRRWPSKAALVVDAITAWREQIAPMAIPDTGSLAGDLDAMATAVPDFDDSVRQQLGVVVGLLTAAWRDPELMVALSGPLERPRQLVSQVLQRALERGEVGPECDVTLIADVLVGLIVLRLLRGQPPDRAFVTHVIDDIVRTLIHARPNG
jgi:AcrR family transcriptional regulator